MEVLLSAPGAADPGMAALSDHLVVAMIVVYAFALLLFAVESAYGRRTPLRARALTGALVGGEAEANGIEVRTRESHPEASAARHGIGLVALGLTALGSLLHVGQIVARGLAAERWPWGNMFEFVVAICLCAVLAFLFVAIRYQARYLGVFVLVPVLLLLGIAVRWLYADAGPVDPALNSYWIAIHVTAAIVATGAFMVSGSVTVAYFLVRNVEKRRAGGEAVTGVLAKLPASELLDRIGHRMVVFAFPLWTFSIIAGAVWADEAWGRFWGWDPKEVWSFITWIVYAAYLHARVTAGWRGPRSAWISLVGFLCLLFNFFGVNYLFSGLHSYA